MADDKKFVKDAPKAAPVVEPSKPTIKYAQMRRKHPQFPGAPITATVHPNEVQNMIEHGWYEES